MHNHKAGRGVASDNRQDKPETLRTQTYCCRGPPGPPGPGHLPPEGSTAAACPESSVRPHCGGRKQGTVAEAPATGCRKRTPEAWVGSLRVPEAYSRLTGRLHGALHVLSWDQGPNR